MMAGRMPLPLDYRSPGARRTQEPVTPPLVLRLWAAVAVLVLTTLLVLGSR